MHIKHIPFCPHLVPLMYFSLLWSRYPQSHLWKEWLLVCNSRMCTSFLPGMSTEWLKTKRYLIRVTRGQIRWYWKNYLKKWCINCCQSLSFPCPWHSLAAILFRTTLIRQSYSTYLQHNGLQTSRPKVISPEVIYVAPNQSYVAQILRLLRVIKSLKTRYITHLTCWFRFIKAKRTRYITYTLHYNFGRLD